MRVRLPRCQSTSSTWSVVLFLASVSASFARADDIAAPSPPAHATDALRAGPCGAFAGGLTVSPEGGRLGGTLVVDARYALPVYRVQLSAGLRGAGYFTPTGDAWAALATTRITAPTALFRLYATGSVGIGQVDRAQSALAYQLGAGALLDLTRWLALGVEASFSQIDGTHLRVLSFGPTLELRL